MGEKGIEAEGEEYQMKELIMSWSLDPVAYSCYLLV